MKFKAKWIDKVLFLFYKNLSPSLLINYFYSLDIYEYYTTKLTHIEIFNKSEEA